MTTNTTSTKKITKRDRYNELLAIEAVNTNPDLVAFIENELNLLAKKNSADKKPTATQVANEEIKNAILAYMKPDEKYTVTDFIKSVPQSEDFRDDDSAYRRKQGTEDHRKARFLFRSRLK